MNALVHQLVEAPPVDLAQNWATHHAVPGYAQTAAPVEDEVEDLLAWVRRRLEPEDFNIGPGMPSDLRTALVTFGASNLLANLLGIRVRDALDLAALAGVTC